MNAHEIAAAIHAVAEQFADVHPTFRQLVLPSMTMEERRVFLDDMLRIREIYSGWWQVP